MRTICREWGGIGKFDPIKNSQLFRMLFILFNSTRDILNLIEKTKCVTNRSLKWVHLASQLHKIDLIFFSSLKVSTFFYCRTMRGDFHSFANLMISWHGAQSDRHCLPKHIWENQRYMGWVEAHNFNRFPLFVFFYVSFSLSLSLPHHRHHNHCRVSCKGKQLS